MNLDQDQEVGAMVEKEKSGEPEVPKKKSKEPLPFCTSAASPEHSRAGDEDEPCDDARGAK
jgi:hypothetical protein